MTQIAKNVEIALCYKGNGDDSFDVDTLTGNDLSLYTMINDGLNEFIDAHNPAPNILSLNSYDFFVGNNPGFFESIGIVALPAIYIKGKYADGTSYFWVLPSQKLDPVNMFSSFNKHDVAVTIKAAYYKEVGAGCEGLIYKIFPPLCGGMRWVWLAAGVFGAYKATQSPNKSGKALWGAGSAYSLYNFTRAK